MEKTFLGTLEVHTYGCLPQVGEAAPDFELVATDLSEIRLSDLRGKKVVLNIFPSIDTEVCAQSVRRFNKDAQLSTIAWSFVFPRTYRLPRLASARSMASKTLSQLQLSAQHLVKTTASKWSMVLSEDCLLAP